MLCLVAQSCPTLCDPVGCSPPGSSVPGDSPGKSTGVGSHALFLVIFPTQGSNPGLSDSLPSEPPGKPKNIGWVAYPLSRIVVFLEHHGVVCIFPFQSSVLLIQVSKKIIFSFISHLKNYLRSMFLFFYLEMDCIS